MRPRSRSDFAIAIICALPLEADAIEALFDETYDRLGKLYDKQPGDANAYINGKIGAHNVVLCYMSGMGKGSAASVASSLRVSYPGIRLALVVGICGGAPYPTSDQQIFLGDVIISDTVIEYDFGSQHPGDSGFQRKTGVKKTLGGSDREILTLLTSLKATNSRRDFQTQMLEYLHQLQQSATSRWQHPDLDDVLFEASDENKVIRRRDRTKAVSVSLHIGTVASADTVMRSAEHRDKVVSSEKVIGFEMEGAGVWNNISCIIIKGVCDYADSHKNKEWQAYAAATGASAAKAFLEYWKPTLREDTKLTKEETACLQSLFITDPADDRNALKRSKGDRTPGTCSWILETDELKRWLGLNQPADQEESRILWLHGNPGTGKSTMAITLTEELPNQPYFSDTNRAFAYFFCDSSAENRRTATAILRGILFQLIKQRPILGKHLLGKYEDRKEKLFTSFDALWAVLMEMGHNYAKSGIYCIIDALDECEPESQQVILRQIDQTFSRHNSKHSSPSNIHVLITSRPYPEIREWLSSFRFKDLASYQAVAHDLKKMIQQRVGILSKKKNYSKALAAEVSRILEDKAEGTFLWVGIAYDELERVPSMRAEKTLYNLPRGLHSLYQQLLHAAIANDDEDDQLVIVEMLTFVAFARRPLTIAELSEACQVSPDKDEDSRLQFTREFVDMCRLMIVIQDEHVQLLHKSVKDFLVKERKEIKDMKANATLAYRCIDNVLEGCRSVIGGKFSEPASAFLGYSVLHWPEHASLSQPEFAVRQEHEKFFQLQSKPWKEWLHQYNAMQTDSSDRLDIGFSTLHAAARWGIPQFISYALNSVKMEYSGLHIAHGESLFIDSHFQTCKGVTPLEEAATYGQLSTMGILLEKTPPGLKVAQNIVEAGAQNEGEGKEVMALLLDRQGDQIQITEKVVKAAARSWESGDAVMALLLDQRGDEIQITEEVVKAAAGNSGSGDAIMTLLLDQRGDEIQITEEVVKAAAENWRSGNAIMKLLLSQRGDEIQITEKVVKGAAENWSSGNAIVKLLLNQRGDEIQITEEVVITIIRRCDKRVVELLLKQQGDKIQITEEVVKAAAENYQSGDAIMTLLLNQRGDEIQITEEVIITIIGRCNKRVVELLLEQRGDQIQITEEVVKAAAGNYRSGDAIMILLLNQRGDEIQITEEVVKAAAGNSGSGDAIMTLLLDQRGDEIQITEEVVKAAVGNLESGDAIMTLLFNRRGDEIQITEEVVKAAAKNYQSADAIMTLLLDRRGDEIQITEEVVKAAAWNYQSGDAVMKLLLDRRGDEIQITEEVVKAAVGNSRSGHAIMKLLLDQRGDEIQITEEVVEAVAGNSRSGNAVMTLLLDRQGDKIQITQEVVKAAAGNLRGGAVMALLLDRRGDEIQITEEVVKAAAKNYQSGDAIMTLLLNQRGDEIQITEEVVEVAARNWDSGDAIMTLLLDRRGDEIRITEEVFITIVGRCDKRIVEHLLKRRGDEIQITEEVVKAAAGNYRSGDAIMALLLDQRGHKIQITEEVVKAAAGNSRSGNAIVTLLLDRLGDEIQITEEVVKAAVGNSRSGHAIMKLLLDQRGYEIQITEEVVKSAARNSRSGNAVMTLLLDRRGDEIQITEEVVKAAAGNLGSGNAVMTLLLDQRGDEIQITEEVVTTIVGRCDKRVVEFLLKRRGDEIQITKEVVKAAVGNELHGHKLLAFLHRRYNTLPTLITDSVLFAAASCGQEATLKYFSRILNIPVSERYHHIAQFYKAAKVGNTGRVKSFLTLGINPDIGNPFGETPLWKAANNGREATVRILLQTGSVNVDSKSILGQSPIFPAAAMGFIGVVRLLLEARAHTQFIDKNGSTAYSLAKVNGHFGIMKLLEDYRTVNPPSQHC